MSYPKDCPAHGRDCRHGDCPDYMAVWLRGACSSGDPLHGALTLVLDEFARRTPPALCRNDANECVNEREVADAWAEIPDAMKNGIRLSDGVRKLRQQRNANGRSGDELAAAAERVELVNGALRGIDDLTDAVNRWRTGQ